MKQSPFPLALFGVVLFVWLLSCSDNATSTTNNSDSTTLVTNNDSEPAGPEFSTVNTTPENIVVVRYRVSDYEKWRAAYDSRDSMRTANGLHNYVLGRGVEDSNTVLVAVKADDMDKAKAFTATASLRSALQKGYVTGTPKYTFTRVVYQDGAKNMSALRSMSFFTVKDWDVWQKAFESGRQWRASHGVTDRAYGYEVDNKNKVVMVAAINDKAKADAYWQSDSLKQRRAAAGVVGNVERFVYRVVQTY